MENTFLEAFFKIDDDSSEEITIVELEKYMRQNNLKEAFVKKWINIFDENKDGVITLDEYCSVLGLIPNEARILRDQYNIEHAAPTREMPDDVQIIFSNMSKEMEIETVYIEKDAWDKSSNPSDVAKYIKLELDKAHEPSWHCIAMLGQYWLYCSAEDTTTLQYKRGKYIYAVWKTPI